MVVPPASPRILRRVLACVALGVLGGSAARAGTSTAQSPRVTFATPGAKTVTMQSCNAHGCSTISKVVNVLDPTPRIVSTSVPSSVPASSVVTLQAVTSGQPPLGASWLLVGPAAQQVSLNGNPTTWTTPASAGTWSVRLTLGNSVGSVSSTAMSTTVVAQDFADVPATHWAWKYIEGIYHRGVTAGCQTSPRLYCPSAPVTRGDMAIFLLVAQNGPGYAPPACSTPRFADVPCSSPYASWVNELARRGVTSGCGGGLYCPGASVTRQEMAVFLLATAQGAGWVPPACVTPSFADVPCSSTYAPWVNELVRRGVTAGCAAGTYCPTAPVDRASMAVLLTGTFHLPAP